VDVLVSKGRVRGGLREGSEGRQKRRMEGEIRRGEGNKGRRDRETNGRYWRRKMMRVNGGE
jgi:hypothetical protein